MRLWLSKQPQKTPDTLYKPEPRAVCEGEHEADIVLTSRLQQSEHKPAF